MASMTRAQRREDDAKQRRLRKYRERLAHEQRRAQRFLHALAQALFDLGLPETLAAEGEWRLQAQVKRLGKIFGVMFPTVCGGRSAYELTQVRVWDKHLPGRLLGALPKQTWLRPWQQRGQALLIRLWPQVADKSPATQSRWPWTWVADDSVFKKAGQPLGLVGTWDSGQEHRVRRGSDGLLLVVVVGDGKLVVPVDFVIRRPDPGGPGRPCRDQLTWWQVMRERTWTVLQRRCRRLPAPLSVADRWFGDSALLAHVQTHLHGTWLVEGKRRYVFSLADGRRVTGADLRTRSDWPGRESPQAPGCRDARRTATSATDGRVTRVLVDTAGEERFYLRCRETTISAPRLIRAWGRRRWIEPTFRTLKHLLAAEACQVQTEEAYDGHLVWRLVAGLVLFYTARFCVQGQVTMEAIVFSLTHHWRFLSSEPLEFHALSWDLSLEAA
jgi:hypothetical protein